MKNILLKFILVENLLRNIKIDYQLRRINKYMRYTIIQLDKKHRFIIKRILAHNGYGWFVILQEKFLFMWISVKIINDMWDRVNGFYSEKRAIEEAEKVKKNYQ